MTKASKLLNSLSEGKKYTMSKTYEVWSYDAVDAGQTDDSGFKYQDQEFDSIWELAKEIRDAGATEPSDSGLDALPGWYSTPDGDENYKTGERTYYSFHPENLKEDEARELFKLVKMNRTEFRKADPDEEGE